MESCKDLKQGRVQLSDRHTNLLRYGSSYGRKKFCNIGPGVTTDACGRECCDHPNKAPILLNFFHPFTNVRNKLKCLSLASLSSFVKSLKVRPGDYLTVEQLKGDSHG